VTPASPPRRHKNISHFRYTPPALTATARMPATLQFHNRTVGEILTDIRAGA